MKRVLAVLGTILLIAAAAVPGVLGWEAVGPVSMPPQGWAALVVGAIVFVALGAGLMGLVFYSSRRGYDERADTTAASTLEDETDR